MASVCIICVEVDGLERSGSENVNQVSFPESSNAFGCCDSLNEFKKVSLLSTDYVL